MIMFFNTQINMISLIMICSHLTKYSNLKTLWMTKTIATFTIRRTMPKLHINRFIHQETIASRQINMRQLMLNITNRTQIISMDSSRLLRKMGTSRYSILKVQQNDRKLKAFWFQLILKMISSSGQHHPNKVVIDHSISTILPQT